MLRIAWFDLWRSYNPRTQHSRLVLSRLSPTYRHPERVVVIFVLSVLQVRTVSVKSDLRARSTVSLVISFYRLSCRLTAYPASIRWFAHQDRLSHPSIGYRCRLSPLSINRSNRLARPVRTNKSSSVLYVCPLQGIYSGYRRYQVWPFVLAG